LFGTAMLELGRWLTYEALRDWLPQRVVTVQTQLATTEGQVVDATIPLLALPLLPAGLGLWEGARTVLPASALAPLWIEEQGRIIGLPDAIGDRVGVLLFVPEITAADGLMLVLERLAQQGVQGERIRIISLLAAAPGLKVLGERWNDLTLYCACIDADVDGQHIRTLILTLLFRFMRPLIEHGYVYLAQPPLYRIKWSNADHQYVYSDEERDEQLAAGQAAGKRIPKENSIQRYKGLGEMDYDELWSTTMDPARRTLLQVTLDDAAMADEVFSTLMGEDVEGRRTFIQRNAKDVRFLDI